MSAKRIATKDTQEWTAAVLRNAGLTAEHAQTTSSVLVRTEMRGFVTHGLTRLASYLEKIR
ncbi:MAG: Ldh family oxidoreductase, partial [Comamonas sp.]